MTIKLDKDRDFMVGEVTSIISESNGGEKADKVGASSLVGDPKGSLVTDIGRGVFSIKGFSKNCKGFVVKGSVRGTFSFEGNLVGRKKDTFLLL